MGYSCTFLSFFYDTEQMKKKLITFLCAAGGKGQQRK